MKPIWIIVFRKADGLWIYNCSKIGEKEAVDYVGRMTEFYTNPKNGKINVILNVFRYDETSEIGIKNAKKRIK